MIHCQLQSINLMHRRSMDDRFYDTCIFGDFVYLCIQNNNGKIIDSKMEDHN